MPIFLTVLMTIFSSQLIAEIYSWKDESGVTHFSENKPAISAADITTISMDKKPATMRINPEERSEQADAADSLLPSFAAIKPAAKIANNETPE